jgi:hypothetical protein
MLVSMEERIEPEMPHERRKSIVQYCDEIIEKWWMIERSERDRKLINRCSKSID